VDDRPGTDSESGRKSALEAGDLGGSADHYYFVGRRAKATHRFARTIEEHNKNVAALPAGYV